MTSEELKNRTKEFAKRVIKMTESLPKNNSGFVIGKQIIRSSTSVAANYRAACRARSKPDFISKITVIEEEADESLFWLELIEELEIITPSKLQELKKEADELTAIFTSIGKTSKINLKNTNPKSDIRNSKLENPNSKIRNQQLESA